MHSRTINQGVPKDEALVLSFMEHDLMLIAEILYFLFNDILMINDSNRYYRYINI